MDNKEIRELSNRAKYLRASITKKKRQRIVDESMAADQAELISVNLQLQALQYCPELRPKH